MKKYWSVARWEYLERVKTKTFLFGLFLFPVIMILFGGLPTLLATRPDTETRVIGVIDQNGSLIEPLQKKLEEKYKLPDGQPNYVLRNMADPRFTTLDDLKKNGNEMVANEAIAGYLLIGKDLYDTNLIEYRSENVGNIRDIERFSSSIREVVTEKKLIQEGIEPGAREKAKHIDRD